MATSLKDSVIHWRKKLERNTDEELIVSVIRKLSKIPISIEILQETHIGKAIRNLSKREDIVGEKALSVLKKWRDAFAKSEEAKLSSAKLSNTTTNKRENTSKESSSTKSSSKHDVKLEKSHQKKASRDENKHKQRSESSASHSSQQSSKTYISNGDHSTSIPKKESSPSLYTYVKKESHAKYTDYDPHTDINEGYNPECPELYPGSKSLKVKKSDSYNDTYEPSSVKRKSSSGEETKTKHKHTHKRLKTDGHSSAELSVVRETKQSVEKKEKHNSHKDKTRKDGKSHSISNPKEESSNKKKVPVSDSSKHKSSSESKSKNKESSGKNSSSKGKIKINSAEEFTSSEVRFEDCLGFNDIVTVKKKKTVKSQSSSSGKKPLTNSNKTSASSSTAYTKAVKASPKNFNEKLCVKVPKPLKLEEVDIISTLPQTLPSYRPLPPRILTPLSKKKVLTNEEAIKFTSSRREKTVVYSGRKSYFTEVPSLFDCSTRILIENIDLIEYMGGVPYFLVKPILDRCSPTQLYNIENYNPYLLEDTHELWEVHCKRDYRLLRPEENETWRELYLRAFEEREQKLKNITANISASMSKSNPVRQVKLAYVDSVAKPPRDVARRQAKHGTALPVSHPMKAGPPAKASPKPTAPAINAAASTVSTPAPIPKSKPKVAPLMAKTLKSMKLCFRR